MTDTTPVTPVVEPVLDVAATEQVLVKRLLNDASEPFEYRGYKFIFKRPKYEDKYRVRAWITKKGNALFDNIETEDLELSLIFNIMGALHSNVHRIFSVVDGKNVEYTYNPVDDIDYKFLFEKFLVEEIYGRKGMDEQEFSYGLAQLFSLWNNQDIIVEDDIKKS